MYIPETKEQLRNRLIKRLETTLKGLRGCDIEHVYPTSFSFALAFVTAKLLYGDGLNRTIENRMEDHRRHEQGLCIVHGTPGFCAICDEENKRLEEMLAAEGCNIDNIYNDAGDCKCS